MTVRILCRAVVFDRKTEKILLVRNRAQQYWYPPGGGWKEGEHLAQCVCRETEEESGIRITLVRLLYVQEFSPQPGETNLELFWLAYPEGSTVLDPSHVDMHGTVEERRWLSREELQSLVVFPKCLQAQFWINVNAVLAIPDPFLA